jgi:hypothetical protein
MGRGNKATIFERDDFRFGSNPALRQCRTARPFHPNERTFPAVIGSAECEDYAGSPFPDAYPRRSSLAVISKVPPKGPLLFG